ncbi:hypothetical protein L1887_29131 [Cichorium endivia]|nr:hypothetical protein L1887_29131 [Cichorium endivia]
MRGPDEKNTLVALALSLFMFIVLLNTESSQKEVSGGETGGRAAAGVYSVESVRSFEPETFVANLFLPMADYKHL